MNAEATTQATKKPARHTPFADRPDDGLIRERDLLPVVSISASTLWRRVGSGTFPKPIKLGQRVTAWRVGEVRQWLAAVGGPEVH